MTHLIVAGNFQQALLLAQSEGLSSFQWNFIRDANQLRGFRGNSVVVWMTGSYDNRPDFEQIEELIKTQELRVEYFDPPHAKG